MAIESIGNKEVAYQGSVSPKESRAKSTTNNTKKTIKTNKKENIILPDKNIDKPTSENLSEVNKENDKFLDMNTQLKKAVEEINNNSKQTEAIFGIHDDTNRVTIKIVDKKSKEVLKEFPPEQTLDMIAKIWEMAGIMVDERG